MSKKEQIRELEITNNDLRLKYNELVEKLNLSEQNNVKLRRDIEVLVDKNKVLAYRLDRLGFSYCAALSLGAIPTFGAARMINNLTSQREKMREQLNEKDYIICQLESALEAAKVI